MMKTVKISFYILGGLFLLLIFPGQIQAINVSFASDTEVGFTGVSPVVYINSGSACDSLRVAASTLNADIPAASTFTLETAAHTILGATPSGGTVNVAVNTAYLSNGYLSQWTASSSLATATVAFSVGVSSDSGLYQITIDGSFSSNYQASNGIVSFTYSGGFSSKTFAITPFSVSGGVGGGAQDITAPSISSVGAVVSDTETKIIWNTNESSLSWILYGTSTNFGLEEKTTNYITSHSINLKNLLPSTIYYYQIKSKDSAGNTGSYEIKTFTTLVAGQKAATEIITKPVSLMSNEELKAEITRITALIVQLQSQLGGISGGVNLTGIPNDFTFKNTLKFGVVLPEVKYLQIVLNSDSQTKISNSGVGSSGHETNIFGALTKAAVIRFQEKYAPEILTPLGLTKGTGIVGNATIKKINSLLKK